MKIFKYLKLSLHNAHNEISEPIMQLLMSCHFVVLFSILVKSQIIACCMFKKEGKTKTMCFPFESICSLSPWEQLMTWKKKIMINKKGHLTKYSHVYLIPATWTPHGKYGFILYPIYYFLVLAINILRDKTKQKQKQKRRQKEKHVGSSGNIAAGKHDGDNIPFGTRRREQV